MLRKRKHRRYKLDKNDFSSTNKVENNNTFYKIVQNIIPKAKPFLMGEKHNNINNNDFFNFEVSSFFNGFINEKGNLVKFYNIVIKNNFISSFSREKIIEVFCKIKRTYNALKLFENICYWRLSSKYKNDEDLCMNPLNRFSSRSLITINQNKTIYTFRISDLLKHINTNLLYTSNYIHEPKLSKNPYNNIEFSLHDYYNIYFRAKTSDYTIPPLFHLLFLDNFDINDFTVNHNPYIRDIYIEYHYKTMSDSEKETQIRKMLLRNSNVVKFVIDRDFPRNILIDAMGHILLDYMYYKYTLNDQKLHYCTCRYQKKLVNFAKYNKLFGRKKMVRNPIKPRGYNVSFEMSYPNFKDLNGLCNNDEHIYDEVIENHEIYLSSDSDSSMSNELANTDNTRIHLNINQNTDTTTNSNTANTNNNTNIDGNYNTFTIQNIDNSNNILSHNFRLLHRMHPNIIPTLPLHQNSFYNVDISLNSIPRRELTTPFNEIQYNESIASILNTIDMQNMNELNLNALHDIIHNQYSQTIHIEENSDDSDDDNESNTEYSNS